MPSPALGLLIILLNGGTGPMGTNIGLIMLINPVQFMGQLSKELLSHLSHLLLANTQSYVIFEMMAFLYVKALPIF